MANVVRSPNASFDGLTAIRNGQMLPTLPGNPLRAGEALDPAAPVYIKSSDGKLYMSSGAAANEAAEVIGFTGKSYVAGEPVTPFRNGTVIKYADGTLTPGNKYFISATAGRLADAATTGDALGVAIALDASNLLVTRASY
ncbi:MAG TPA: hypothetical protein VF576_12845 [Rubricoccaceae bacterium]|jgi:hypothetical protein